MNLDAWHDLFLAAAGAGAALAGLIIVAMSVNVRTILAIPSMTSRAATTVAGLILIVVVSCAALVPAQPAAALGIEIALAATVALTLAVRSAGYILRARTPAIGLGLTLGKAALGVLPTAGMFLGGILLIRWVDTGLYLVAGAVIVGFATSVTNAWVLLVEILR
ncbi:hypothetical protein [Nocardia sp. NPDC057227]|uniref:hypothetical protein n=1 Tax=Nocardia sp. NPDC057227 TaxID=3346056 RepID=UPI00363D97DB